MFLLNIIQPQPPRPHGSRAADLMAADNTRRETVREEQHVTDQHETTHTESSQRAPSQPPTQGNTGILFQSIRTLFQTLLTSQDSILSRGLQLLRTNPELFNPEQRTTLARVETLNLNKQYLISHIPAFFQLAEFLPELTRRYRDQSLFSAFKRIIERAQQLNRPLTAADFQGDPEITAIFNSEERLGRLTQMTRKFTDHLMAVTREFVDSSNPRRQKLAEQALNIATQIVNIETFITQQGTSLVSHQFLGNTPLGYA